MTTDIVRVPLADRAYDIHIGENLLEQAGALIAPLLKRPRVVIVTDENVHAAQGKRLTDGLAASGIESDAIVLKPGEQTKSFAELERLTGRLLDLGVERSDLVLAFGGGVIGDLTGFASAILRRGCRFAQLPTTLLAQVDSAVGGKTAINTPQGKNLIGAFYQPAIVLADIDALVTLPAREVKAGYAEVVKYGLIADSDFFKWLEQNGAALLAGDARARIHAVKISCERKAAIVGEDEREHGKRALLNLGHTFGHAFEAHFGYSDRLLHGEGVALGMALAYDYAVRRKMCSPDDAARVIRFLASAGMHHDPKGVDPNLTAEELIGYMLQDKKVEQGALTLILPTAIGDAKIVKDANIEDVTAFLKEKLGH